MSDWESILRKDLDNISTTSAVNGSKVDIKILEEQGHAIKSMTDMHSRISSMVDELEKKIIDAKNTHEKDMFILRSIMDDKGGSSNSAKDEKQADTWQHVSKKQKNKSRKAKISKGSISVDIKKSLNTDFADLECDATGSNRDEINITEALKISATRVPTFDYVKQDGQLYYVEGSNHFAFFLSGKLFHGNIGNIYTDDKNPEKIKNCKYKTSCMKRDRCDYFHNPLHLIGSKDVRNFIASSWLYAPPDSDKYRGKSGSRRFGSRNNLDIDIMNLQDEEVDRFCDQTMHDVLCSLILMKYARI